MDDQQCKTHVARRQHKFRHFLSELNPLNAELNPICHLLALLGAHHILHVSRIRVKINPPVPVAARSDAWVCSTSPAEIVGSNPTGGHGYLSFVCCKVEVPATG